MADAGLLRERARRYRRLADGATDAAVADSYRLLAEIDDDEADLIEKRESDPPLGDGE